MTTTTETALDRLRNTDDVDLYETDSRGCNLTEAGVQLAEAAGLTVDVDAYGNAYVVETTTETYRLYWIDSEGTRQDPGEEMTGTREECEAAAEDLRESDPETWGTARFVIEAE